MARESNSDEPNHAIAPDWWTGSFDTPQGRREEGKARRKTTPRSSHGEWQPPADRVDPVTTVASQDTERLQFLVPVRHKRMAESPFAFYRGAAKVMAADLASTPVSGLEVQLCGDAHLSNFGSFASPERQQVFDVNDFDETLLGPFEWDLKRLAASVVLASRANGLSASKGREATIDAVSGYRDAMAAFADARTLDLWYSALSLARVSEVVPKKSSRKRFEKTARKWRGKNSERALGKLTERRDGRVRIKSDPPLLIPLRDVPGVDADELDRQTRSALSDYASTLQENRRALLRRFTLIDVAIKVVGVGSVGTRCLIALFLGRDDDDPLFLQLKEATTSVLEDHLPASRHAHHGERVVAGQRLMQATSDVFLGWSTVRDHDFYWRQYHDMKGSADVAGMNAKRLSVYAGLCGWTLSHAHARSGDPIAIAGYLGKGSAFPEALADFAEAYADQNDRDYDAYMAAIRSGRIEAHEEGADA